MSAKLQLVSCRFCGEVYDVTGNRWAELRFHVKCFHREEWKSLQKRLKADMRLKLPNKAG